MAKLQKAEGEESWLQRQHLRTEKLGLKRLPIPIFASRNKNGSMQQAEWFEEWFDSPYYHILYRDRDESEAEGFIDHLLQILAPPDGAKILDLACGKGRYSLHLAKKGFEVVGLDLSAQSIAQAKRLERDNLRFLVHDMRQPLPVQGFDYIFNFFTSFGYFDTEAEDLQTLKNVQDALKTGGLLVLDFFNAHYVRNRLTGWEQKTIDGVKFDLHKRIEGKHVVKAIHFQNGDQRLFYEERVRLFTLEDFQRLLGAAGLKLKKAYGDYQLQPFDKRESPRLILIAEA